LPNLTLEDIAKLAGVSRSTVSRVVNERPNVRKDVRERVLGVIKNTGYHPNAAARTLVSQRTWTIGLILPHSVGIIFTDPFFPHLTKGIAQACNDNNYTLALFLAGSKEDEKKIFPSISQKGLVDGAVVQVGHHGDQGIIERMIDGKIPFVVIGRPFNSDNVSYIDVNNTNGAYSAVTHLIRAGYQRIATITGPINSTVGIDRKKGYCKALNERGMTINEDLIVEGDFTEAGGHFAMQQLLSIHPDAVFAASDTMAIGAMRAVLEAGLRIPDDIAFVGFDDLPIATLSEIKLTTIRQPVVQFGEKSIEILIDLIENGVNPPRHVIMDTELVIRDSCGSIHRREMDNMPMLAKTT
jgi:LacI family transcriptional regulator